MKRNYGFSLIEIAIVVAIGVTLLSLGLAAINSQLSSANYSITKKRQDAIKDALISYLGSHSSLPCPYVPTAGSVVTGIAPAQSGAPPACPLFGTVPFGTLSLARETVEDGWGSLMSYQVYTEATPACPGIGRDWGNGVCFGTGKSGGLTVNDGTVAAPISLATSVVAVVISHGANGLGAWATQGTRNANPVTCEEAHNAKITTVPSCTLAANTYYKGESQTNDDVIAHLTANDVLQPLVKQGTIKSAIAKVNDDLANLYAQAVGLNLTSSNCQSLPSLPLDPWGKQYNFKTSGGSVPICFWSNGASGSDANSACACISPTVCIPVLKTVLDPYRVLLGKPVC